MPAISRKIWLLTLALSPLFILGAKGQSPADTLAIITQINTSETVSVSYPEGFLERLKGMPAVSAPESAQEDAAIPAKSSKTSAKVGYRVQVFDDNNVHTAKNEAQHRKNQLASRFPEFKAYLQFNSPYWRVKVGDFATRSEADAAAAAIKAAFPAFASQLRVVRDRINH